MEREIEAVTGISSAVGPVRWACLSGSGAGSRIALELSFSRRKPAFFSRRNDRRRDVTGRCITLPRIRVAVAFHPGVHALFRVHPGLVLAAALLGFHGVWISREGDGTDDV